jgi:hypothetical protein
MPTIEEVLRQSGFSDSEIEQFDGRARNAFSGVLNAAQQEREQAELAKRSNVEFYETKIMPSLNLWEDEKNSLIQARADAEANAAFYREQNQSLRNSGVIPGDAPNYQRDGKGRFVAGENGSPTFEPSEIVKRAGDGLAMIADVDWKHRSLYNGQPLPIAPSQLIAEADRVGQDPATYAANKFGFQKREQELATQRQKEHDDTIRREERAIADREWAEKTGHNPDIRRAAPSANIEVSRAVKSGQRVDPLTLNDQQRHAVTQKQIHDRINSRDDAA